MLLGLPCWLIAPNNRFCAPNNAATKLNEATPPFERRACALASAKRRLKNCWIEERFHRNSNEHVSVIHHFQDLHFILSVPECMKGIYFFFGQRTRLVFGKFTIRCRSVGWAWNVKKRSLLRTLGRHEASAQAQKQLQRGASAEHLKREWVFFFTQIVLCTLTLIKSLLLWILSACLNARNSGYAFKYRYSVRAHVVLRVRISSP